MMKFLRKKENQKRVFTALAIVIIPAFVLWGVFLSKEDNKGSSHLGVIENEKFSLKDYLASYKAIQHRIAFVYGDRAAEMAPLFNIKGEAWDRLLLLHYAKQERIKTGDKEVVQWLVQQPLFSRQGKFDTNFYNLYVNNYMRMNPREFEEEIRQNITLDKVRERVRSNIALSDEVLKGFYDQAYGQRDIAYAVVSWETEKNNVTIADEELQKIYPLVKEKLVEPQKIKIDYLFIPKEKADALAGVFKEKNASLPDLAKKYNLPVQETGFFYENESIPGIGLSKEILDASFSLPAQAESDWIKLDAGSYKIRVKEKTEKRSLSFEETKEDLRKLLVRQRATDLVVKKLNALKLKMNGSSFEKVLAEEGIEVKTFSKFQKGSNVPSVGVSETLESVAADLKEGEISEGFAAGDGGVLLKISKDGPADKQNFEKDKEAFRQTVIDKKFEEAMRTLLEGLRNKLKIDLETMRTIFAEDEQK